LRSARGLRVLLAGVAKPAVVVVLVAVSVVAPLSAALARSAGEGAVRTTVAVSLRGTACWLARVASCGVTPTAEGADAPAAGAGLWAETLAMTSASRVPRGIDLIQRFMFLPLFNMFEITKTVFRQAPIAS
jgi:hypothetical protein